MSAPATVERATSSGRASWPWRVVLLLSGFLFLAGGLTHPPGDDVPVREGLVDELAHTGWHLSHTLLLVAALIRVGGLVLMRRDEVLRERLGSSLPLAIVAGALFALEMVPHIFATRDLDALRAGEPTPVIDVHLWLAAGAYPLMGLAMAWLAWNLGRIGGLPQKAVAAIGIFGSLVYGAAPPLALLSEGALNMLFPLGAIPHAWWLVLLGLVGAGVRSTRTTDSAGEPSGRRP